ncbi:MAG: hypothetical protein JF606_24790 [Burkholderiales bacterium]|nr:hypothetical protein [Burkholderiales bacterium]
MRMLFRIGLLLLALVAGCGGSSSGTAQASLGANSNFGLSSDAEVYTVDTGAGLVFKVRRHNSDGSSKRLGDISSLVYQGVEYQDGSKGSQINSGFDFLYTGVSAVSVDAALVDPDHIKITVKAGDLTHYYLAQRGEAKVYMATYFTTEPDTLGLARFIVRVPIGLLPLGPAQSDLRGNRGAIEAHDIFGMPNGETRSKHYSNIRLKDWAYIGATSPQAGVWIVRDSNEGNSGGPFYRSLLNQGTDTDQEITYIINYGEAQTESFRTGVLNSYTLAFTDGRAPDRVDTRWFASMGLSGYVAPTARGSATGAAISGRDPHYRYTVGFSNASAQYWADADDADGHFLSTGMLPGRYTMQVYKNELAVDTRSVVVEAAKTTSVGTVAVTNDPSTMAAIWRIGDWDGTPCEFLNGDKVTTMHPSDVRMQPWQTADYVVDTSTPVTGFPAYQWKDVNRAITVRFKLSASQIADMTLRLGITTAFAGGRPVVKLNQWAGPIPIPSTQPSTRTLTIGSYRGNNTTFSVAIPASAFVAGDNVLTLSVASGTSGTAYLSPGVAYDAIDLIRY